MTSVSFIIPVFNKSRYLKYIVENQIDNLDGFKSFNEDGFKWQDNGFIKKV